MDRAELDTSFCANRADRECPACVDTALAPRPDGISYVDIADLVRPSLRWVIRRKLFIRTKNEIDLIG